MNLALELTFDGHRVRLVGTRERPLWIARDVACALQIVAEKPWKGIAKKHLDHVTVGVNGTRQVMVGVDRAGLLKLIESAPDRDASVRLNRAANDLYSTLAKPAQTSLIEASVPQPTAETVDARMLHQQMGVGRLFPTWIKEQIQKHGLVPGADYVESQSLRVSNPESAKSRPQLTTEYSLTLDAAKRIKTAQNTPEAREVQGKLISAHERFASLLENDDAFIAEALIRSQRIVARYQAENGELQVKNSELNERLAIVEPKAELADRITRSESERNLQTAARQVFRGQPNLGIGQWLKDGLLFRDANRTLLPYEPYLRAGYFRVIVTESKLDGRAFNQTVVTSKGLAYLAARYPDGPQLPESNS